ncbi:MAG: hypothetical protein ACRBBR_09975 [Cellvibrionaceae bacterium]
MQSPVFEMLTWRSAINVKDSEMIRVMTHFSEVVEKLPGFLYQSLYKNAASQWVCIYFWSTEKEAYASNELVANTVEFAELMALIEKESVTMEVFSAMQSTGHISFVAS